MSNVGFYFTGKLPICKCNGSPRVKLLTVKKPGPNCGKEFFCCSVRPEDGGCKFFAWHPLEYGKAKDTFKNGKCKRCGFYGCASSSMCRKEYTYGGIPIPKEWENAKFVEYVEGFENNEEDVGEQATFEEVNINNNNNNKVTSSNFVSKDEEKDNPSILKKMKKEENEVPWKSIPEITHIQSIIDFVKNDTKDKDQFHDFSHSQRVATTAMEIINAWSDKLEEGKEEKQNEEERIQAPFSNSQIKVVIFASYFQYLVDENEEEEDKVAKFLEQYCTEKELTDILDIVFNTSLEKEIEKGYPSHLTKSLVQLRDIVSDSEKIDHLGRGGEKRYLEKFRLENKDKDEDFHFKLFIEKCQKELLLLMNNYIVTEEGKKLSKKGHEYLESVVDNYLRVEQRHSQN
jgi:hypothetical protein